jgi:hypothetical protein
VGFDGCRQLSGKNSLQEPGSRQIYAHPAQMLRVDSFGQLTDNTTRPAIPLTASRHTRSDLSTTLRDQCKVYA